MLARSNRIEHPSGEYLQTPLLIPSFSSKGFRFKKHNDQLLSEVNEYIDAVSEIITEAALVSAYDLKHGYINNPNDENTFLNPKITFIDSGGYETIEGYDFSEVYQYPNRIQKWNLEDYENVLKEWDMVKNPSVVVSYDHGGENQLTLSNQIDRAHKLFNKFDICLSNFLIKPSVENELIDIELVLNEVSDLKGFDIIGLTEKELGPSLVDRMQNIAVIRKALDNEGINSPLHIFGSLDPLTSTLYFLSGAEIFDGLTWLRYSYHNGNSIYPYNYYAISNRIHETDSVNKLFSLNENISNLDRLQYEMRECVKNDGSVEGFTDHVLILKQIYSQFESIINQSK